jgi:hypothetical protein
VRQHDPAGMDDMGETDGSGPITITVTEPSGRTYTYDEAFKNGSVITARRTLRERADIQDLPDTIISQLIASWSPPEWIRAEVSEDIRTGKLTMLLDWWRLNVTYDGMFMMVDSIHTPWARHYTMSRNGEEPIDIYYIDAKGKKIGDMLPYDEPMRVEVVFDKPPEADTRPVRLSWSGDKGSLTWVDVMRTGKKTIYRSDEFMLTSPPCAAGATESIVAEVPTSCSGGIDAFKF